MRNLQKIKKITVPGWTSEPLKAQIEAFNTEVGQLKEDAAHLASFQGSLVEDFFAGKADGDSALQDATTLKAGRIELYRAALPILGSKPALLSALEAEGELARRKAVDAQAKRRQAIQDDNSELSSTAVAEMIRTDEEHKELHRAALAFEGTHGTVSPEESGLAGAIEAAIREVLG